MHFHLVNFIHTTTNLTTNKTASDRTNRCSSNSTKIALEMQKETGLSFKSNEIRLARFLKHSDFQVDDSLWRIYIKLLFGLMKERKALKLGSKINVYVDHTTMKKHF